MPYDPKLRSEHAAKAARGAGGRFVSKKAEPTQLPPPTPVIETSVTTPIPPETPNGYDKSLDAPLVSVSVNNPFKKILHWIDEIRRKQTTTFDFKIKIPLIALPFFIAILGGSWQLFFNFGQKIGLEQFKTIPTPTPVVIKQIQEKVVPVRISRAGVIKATYQLIPSIPVSTAPVINTINSVTNLSSISDYPTPTPTPTATPEPTKSPYRFVLVDKNDSITFLSNASFLSSFTNKKVLITGIYDPTQNILTVSRQNDIELLD